MTDSNGNGRPLTLDEILAAQDCPAHRMDVPEWGGHVYVRPISSNDRDELEAWALENERRVGWRALVASKVLCTAEGDPLEGIQKKILQLGRKNGDVLDRIVSKAYQLAGYTQEEQEKLEGNSPGGPSDDSG